MGYDKGYRENPSRAIYLTGIINQELVDKVTPTLNQFRFESSDPITVYIDSPGGSVFHADIIRNLVKAPRPDSTQCRLITVVTGIAYSAAAVFLAKGDYALAYDHTEILFHGLRRNLDQHLTSEEAHYLANYLKKSNEGYALELARVIFPRFILRISQLPEELKAYRNSTINHREDLLGILNALRKNLRYTNENAVLAAHKKQGIIAELTYSIWKEIIKNKRYNSYNRREMETKVFQAILTYKSKKHSKDSEEWLLSKTGLEEIAQDFHLYIDFYLGEFKSDLPQLIKDYGFFVISDQSQKSYKNLKDDENMTREFYEHASKAIRPLWYFTVSLCRILQTADYTFNPIEAYWLGFIDEVPGTGLPNLREFVEALPESDDKQE